MKINLNQQQLEWLRTIVQYRVEDEQAEMSELVVSKHTDAIDRCQQRINMWDSILKALAQTEA